MHTLLHETKGDFVAIEVTGKLEKNDYEILVPLLETLYEPFT